MSQQILYENLFELKILHHFFLDKGEVRWDEMLPADQDKILAMNDIREIFEITPTPECRQAMLSYHCILKNTHAGIRVGIKSVPDELQPGKFKAVTPPAPGLVLKFTVRRKDPDFPNYTALPIQGNENTIFVFKNYTAGANIKFPSLSAIPPLYDAALVYQPGDMLSDSPVNPAKLFTALLKTSNNTSNGTDWITETGNPTTPLSYANSNDRYRLARGMFVYTMKEPDSSPVAIIKTLSGGPVNPKSEILPGEFYSFQADMQNFPQGFYRAHITSANPLYQDDFLFYLLHQSEPAFGIIEIKTASDQADFNLLDGDVLLSPVFRLRFRNRRTHWRYLGKDFEVPFEVEDPLPLTRFGQIEVVKPPAEDDNGTVLLPNPTAGMIRTEALAEGGDKKYYSEIHIN
jgi:hypothetical protein